MPKNIKISLSIITLLVGVLVYAWELEEGNEELSLVAFGLSIFMILAMWLFPETSQGQKDEED